MNEMKIFNVIPVVFLSFLSHNIYAQVSFGNIALTGVTIIDARHHTPLPNQTVLIKNNIISNVFKDDNMAIPGSFNILRMEGKYLLPGLIDTHVHMATDPSGEDNRAHTLDVLQHMLYSGNYFREGYGGRCTYLGRLIT